MIWWRSFLFGVAIGIAFVLVIAHIAVRQDEKKKRK